MEVNEQNLFEISKEATRAIHEGAVIRLLAHDLRNYLQNLNAELSDLNLAASSALRKSPKYNRAINSIGKTTEKMRSLAQTISSYGRQEYRKESVDLIEILRNCCEILNPKLGRRRIDIRPNASHKIHFTVTCFKERLQVAFLSILTNSIEATRSDGLITVELRPVNSYFQVVIEDNGVGIPELDAQHLFEPSFTTKERFLGLGLSVSKEIIQKVHKGEISISSDWGKGTKVDIRIPTE